MDKKRESKDPTINKEAPDIEPVQPQDPVVREVPQMPGHVVSAIPRKSIMDQMLDNPETPMLIIEQIESARKLAKKTGQRIRHRFNKKQFIQQFPQAGSDPRFAFTPDTFRFDISPMVALSVGELRDLCLRCKGHPLSLQKAMHVEGLGDQTTIYILKEEYNILAVAAK